MSNRAGKRGKDKHTYAHTYIYRQSLYVPSGAKNVHPFSLPFASHWNNVPWLLSDMFSVVCWAGESLFYIRVRPWGSKQRQPVVMRPSFPLISCVVGRVSLISPDSCHSLSQCTIVDSDTHQLLHQNAASVERKISHRQQIASVKYIMHASNKQQTCFCSCRLVSLQENPVTLLLFC